MIWAVNWRVYGGDEIYGHGLQFGMGDGVNPDFVDGRDEVTETVVGIIERLRVRQNVV